MSEVGLLRWAIDALEVGQVPYMICGSLASSVYGEARATNDVDVVIDPTSEQLKRFLSSVPPTFYVSHEAAASALAQRRMFNVIDPGTGGKIDLVIRKSRSFSIQELERRRRIPFSGKMAYFASPEDIILSKLEWASLGSSQRQVEDAAHVARIQAKSLDVAYLRRWAGELGVAATLETVLKFASDA